MTKRSQFVVMTALAAEAISMAPRLVVISGCGSRGVGLGVARQVLKHDASAQVVVMARTLERAAPKIIDQDCTVFTGKVDDATKQAVEQALATATGEQTAAATAEQTATAALAALLVASAGRT